MQTCIMVKNKALNILKHILKYLKHVKNIQVPK